ncbi:Liprin-beta-1 [Lamellibrachia satsuma]|nr:Liprin-beta-1 [Lamellibrachia satsuma]
MNDRLRFSAKEIDHTSDWTAIRIHLPRPWRMEDGFDYSLYYQTLPRRRKKNLYSLDGSQSSHKSGACYYGNTSTSSMPRSSGSESQADRLESEKEHLTLQVSVLKDQIDAQADKIRDLERALDERRAAVSMLSNGDLSLKVSNHGNHMHSTRRASSRSRMDVGTPPQVSVVLTRSGLLWPEVTQFCLAGDILTRAGSRVHRWIYYTAHVANMPGELKNPSTLETHKLDLLAEISNLKLKLASSERERCELDERTGVAQKRIDELQSRLNDRTIEVTELRSKVARNGTISSLSSDTEFFRDRTMEREKTLERLKRKHTEVERLKHAVETLMITNEEKDSRIRDMEHLLKRYKKMEEHILQTQGKQGLEQLGFTTDDSSDTTSNNSLDLTVKDAHQMERLEIVEVQDVIRRHRQAMPDPSATSTPVNCHTASALNGGTSPPSTINCHSPSPKHMAVTNKTRSNSCENVASSQQQVSPQTNNRKGTLPSPAGTLPRDARLSSSTIQRSSSHRLPPLPPKNTSGSSTPTNTLTLPRKSKSFKSFGKGFFKLRNSGSARWSSSAPNLAETEAEEEALKDRMAQQYKTLQAGNAQRQQQQRKKSKGGIRRLFGRLRRSSSQDLNTDHLEDFKRNGVRATAGPRLGWSRDLRITDLNVPFPQWDTDRIALWLHSMGLSMYIGECKRWVQNGEQLLRASSQDLEKELGMRNYFHRKKLQLALQSACSDIHSRMDDIDHKTVTKWLDDIGLPQYKDQFAEARVDGRMLHYLTVDDLIGLKVTNALHHLSIKQGIWVLRNNDFNLNMLKRRPAPDEGSQQNCANDVVLWTNHRVMEWLRCIDLSEYAPNLRGSGVHGGLMVLEPRFTAEVFACILSISSTKTLLRRHLNAHFIALIGKDMQQLKRETEGQPGFTPLTPNQKMKLRKNHGLFGHKRTKSEDCADFVCPLDTDTGDRAKRDRNGGTLSRNGTLSTRTKDTNKCRNGVVKSGDIKNDTGVDDAYIESDTSGVTNTLHVVVDIAHAYKRPVPRRCANVQRMMSMMAPQLSIKFTIAMASMVM